MPSPTDLAELPFLREALFELILLAVAGGMLGAWIVLRRLAFFTHAVGSASFPGLVLASAWGIAPQLAALATALGFGAAQEGLTRSRRLAPDAATGLLLVAALAIGIVLASDVVEVGALMSPRWVCLPSGRPDTHGIWLWSQEVV